MVTQDIFRVFLVALPHALLAKVAHAVDSTAPALAGGNVSRSPVGGADLLQLTLGLLAVLLGVFALAWLLRRTGRFQLGTNSAMRVIGGMSLGARERVVLVQVGRTQLLLGVAPGRVETLHVLENEARISAASPAATTFAERMAIVLGRSQ